MFATSLLKRLCGTEPTVPSDATNAVSQQVCEYVVPAAQIAKTLQGGSKPSIVNKNLQARKEQTMSKPSKTTKIKQSLRVGALALSAVA